MTDVTPEQPPIVSFPEKPKKKKLTTKAWIGIAAGSALLVTGIILLIVALTASPTNGFYNMNTLEQSVQQQVDQNNNYPIGATVTSCSMTGSNTANCIVDDGGGQTNGVTVTISSDGNTWAQTNP